MQMEGGKDRGVVVVASLMDSASTVASDGAQMVARVAAATPFVPDDGTEAETGDVCALESGTTSSDRMVGAVPPCLTMQVRVVTSWLS